MESVGVLVNKYNISRNTVYSIKKKEKQRLLNYN